MAGRSFTRSFSSSTTNVFPKMPADGPQVVDVSGQPSTYTEMVPRPNTITPPRPGQALRHRTPVAISGATTGPALGRFTEEAAANTVRHLTIAETVDRAGAGPREQDLLDHVFGVNLRGR